MLKIVSEPILNSGIECTGILISSSVVLTAAHCFSEYDSQTENIKDVLEETDFITLYAGFDDVQQIHNRDNRHSWRNYTQKSTIYYSENSVFINNNWRFLQTLIV